MPSPSCAATNPRSSRTSRTSCCRTRSTATPWRPRSCATSRGWTTWRSWRWPAPGTRRRRARRTPSAAPPAPGRPARPTLRGRHERARGGVAGPGSQETTRALPVFGRTPGAEPRLYYYRQFIDGRRWTAWSKVDVDIKSDLLVPLISNERLHLVWPEFREEPVQPSHVSTPEANKSSVPVGKPQKKMNVFLAISEYRNGKWTPKKVSEQPVESPTFHGDAFDRG